MKKRLLAIGVLATLFATALLAVVAPSPASAALPGYRVVPGTSGTQNLTTSKILQISCGDNQRALGAGYDITGGDNDVVVTALAPSPAGVFIAAQADRNGADTPWRIDGWVVCVDKTLPGLEYRSAQGPVSATDTFPATASCTGTKRLVGAGFTLSGVFNGEVMVPNVLLDTASVTVTGAETEGGFTRTRSIFATAVCADPLPGLKFVPGPGSAFNSDSPKQDDAFCSSLGSTSRLIGLGWGLGGDGQVILRRAAIDGTRSEVLAFEDDNGFAGSWSVGTTAICATL